jgi:hypothetical protein
MGIPQWTDRQQAAVKSGSSLCRDKEEIVMQKRLEYLKAYPDAYKAMLALSTAIARTGLSTMSVDVHVADDVPSR